MSGAVEEEHVVHEAIGPPIGGVEVAGALGVGVNSLLVLGVLPVMLGALAAEHRLSEQGIGLAAMIEVLTMGVSTALAGILLKPRRLKLIGLVFSLAMAGADLASAGASGVAILALRCVAGAIEGVLLWITVAMIARTITPERWAGVFFTAQTAAQLALSLALALWVLPRFGATGGFLTVTFCALVGAGAAAFAPSVLPDLNPGEEIAGPPPLRGWVALVGTLIFVAGGGAVGVYLQPLAAEIGLGAGVARTALSASLAAQVMGATAATIVAGRVRWFHVFLVVTVIDLLVWRLFAAPVPAWLFVAANATGGFAAIFLAPFLVPMTIEADRSRRAAVQSGAAQLLGSAMGPALAATVINDRDVHGALWLGAGLLLTGLATLAWLHVTHRPEAAPA